MGKKHLLHSVSFPVWRCETIPDLLQQRLCLVSAHLAHFALAVGREERHVVDLVYHHKVLLLSLEVLQQTRLGGKQSLDVCHTRM